MITPLLASFENACAARPDVTFFTFVDASGDRRSFSYRETRRAARALARTFEGAETVALDLENCPAFVGFVLAAAYGGFTLVALNHRLTAAEKSARLEALRAAGVTIEAAVDRATADRLIDWGDPGDEASAAADEAGECAGDASDADVEADRCADVDARAIILFTTGTTRTPKAVPLAWRQLVGAADAANTRLGGPDALWQATLPFYHVGGLQILIRSLRLERPFLLYERFDATRVLDDAIHCGATHLSVVDKTLRDLLECDGDDIPHRCLLLGGGPLNQATLERAWSRGLSVFASYGMTETASLIAAAPATGKFDGGLQLLEGYHAALNDPDPRGCGTLAVMGPGVTEGYLNAPTPRTEEGAFLTGDRARIEDGRLFIEGRADDVFISGGENVSPAEIVSALTDHPTVTDAVAFGVEDETWGKRPVAVVECEEPLALPELRSHVRQRLSRLYEPTSLLLTPAFQRQGIGKIDRVAVRELYERRIAIERVRLTRVRLPLRAPHRTARTVLHERDLILVEIFDREGRCGLGEGDAFATAWYLPETQAEDWAVLETCLIPYVLSEAFAHPRDVSAALATLPEAAPLPMARSALECACWDLYGSIVKAPLWKLIAEEYRRLQGVTPSADGMPHDLTDSAPAGAALGIDDPAIVVAEARRCVEAGYRRIKLKIAPGHGLKAAQALRAAFPDLLITLDANQSFSEDDLAELDAYDELAPGWIEEPLAPVAGEDQFARLAQLQHQLTTPICLDESFVTDADARRALSHPELRSFALKPAKFGGVEPTLAFIRDASRKGCRLWIGGLYEAGIARRVNAAFEVLDAIDAPGDLGEPARIYPTDLTSPPYRVVDGLVSLDVEDPAGLGCALNQAALTPYIVETVECV